MIDGFREFVDGNATDIRGLKPIDDKIIEIDTREPFAPLPELLASPAFGIVPKGTGSSAELDKSPVTSGPYELTGRDGEVWHLRKTRSTPSPTPVDRIDLVRFASTPDSYGAFVDGKLDWSLVPADKVADATTTYGAGAVTPFTIEQFFGMNMGSPTFANEKFRQAIAKAVDRKALIDAAIPGRPVLNGAVPPGVPGVVDDACGAACQPDPDAARKLLAEAFPDGKVPPLEIATYDDPAQKQLAEGLRDQLKAVGIDASVAVKAVEEYAKYLVSGQQQLFALGWVGLYPDPDAYLAPLFLSSSLDNVTGYSSPDLDGALKEARGVSDRSARIGRYADMQRSVMAQLPIIPLAATNTNAVVAKRVQGYQGRLDGTFDIDSLELAG